MNRFLSVILVCLGVHYGVAAQVRFRAVLINSIDSTVIQNAAVSIGEIRQTVITNEHGEFSCTLAAGTKEVTLAISAIGNKTTIRHHLTGATIERVYIELLTADLESFTVVGLSAEEVVRKAVASIPQNFADSSFFCPSSYRQYEKVNGKYCNLIEARPVVMFKIEHKPRELTYKTAFAVNDVRRTQYVYEPGHPERDNLQGVLDDDQVYHLEKSSINPRRFSKYRFAFDTSAHADSLYVIKYFINDFSMETHGAEELNDKFWGESYEKGVLTIERGSFAIVRLQRSTYRYRDYTYPKGGGNNWVIPERLYYIELRDATLDMRYTKHNGKWYPGRLLHEYTNEFYRQGWSSLDYVVTCYFEWQADSVTRYTTDDFVNKFRPKLQGWGNATNKDAFDFPFYLADKEDVYKDMGHGNGEPDFIDQIPAKK